MRSRQFFQQCHCIVEVDRKKGCLVIPASPNGSPSIRPVRRRPGVVTEVAPQALPGHSHGARRVPISIFWRGSYPMPVSHFINRRPILRHLRASAESSPDKPLEILDLGIGLGNFGKLIKSRLGFPTILTGVEVFEQYRNNKWNYYDQLFISEIVEFLGSTDRSYDHILLIDVLEHFERDQGLSIIQAITERALRSVLVSTPTTAYPQDDAGGNPYETHRYIWSDSEITGMGFARQHAARVPTLRLSPLFVTLGVYAYESDPRSGS